MLINPCRFKESTQHVNLGAPPDPVSGDTLFLVMNHWPLSILPKQGCSSMHRFLTFVAIAILTLIGSVEVTRTMAGSAQMVCLCGCRATSEAACKCSAKPAVTQNPVHSISQGPAGSSCPTTNTPDSTSVLVSSTGLAEESRDENGLRSKRHSEPKPWPGSATIRSQEVLSTVAPAQIYEASGIYQGRRLDRIARLAVFRI